MFYIVLNYKNGCKHITKNLWASTIVYYIS